MTVRVLLKIPFTPQRNSRRFLASETSPDTADFHRKTVVFSRDENRKLKKSLVRSDTLVLDVETIRVKNSSFVFLQREGILKSHFLLWNPPRFLAPKTRRDRSTFNARTHGKTSPQARIRGNSLVRLRSIYQGTSQPRGCRFQNVAMNAMPRIVSGLV